MRRADHSSRGVIQIVVYLMCDREASVTRRPWPTEAVAPRGKKRSVSSDYTENKTNRENRGICAKKKKEGEKRLHFTGHNYPLKTNEYFAVRYT